MARSAQAAARGPESWNGAAGVLIIAGCFAGQGGLQRHLSALARSLTCQRTVTVLTWAPWARPRSELRPDGVRIVVVPSILDWGSDHHPVGAAINTAFSLLTGLTAAWLLRMRWSVACAAGLQPEGTVAALAAWGKRSFVVTTWLVGPLGNVERLRQNSVSRRLLVRLLKGARWFVPWTDDAAAELIDLGLPRDRITVLGAGIDLRHFQAEA